QLLSVVQFEEIPEKYEDLVRQAAVECELDFLDQGFARIDIDTGFLVAEAGHVQTLENGMLDAGDLGAKAC
ncbi:MAG: hypothetical protein P8X52_02055, partial [Limibacillus sp.]